MPAFWRSWLFQLDPFTRLIGGMVVTALHELPVVCRPSELNSFTAPAGQTCGDYMQPFFDRGGAGYLVDNATSSCQYCAFRMGDQFYTPLGFSFDNRWRDMGIYLSFVGSNLIIFFLAVRNPTPSSRSVAPWRQDVPSMASLDWRLIACLAGPLSQLQQEVVVVLLAILNYI